MPRYLLSPDQSLASRRVASWSFNVMNQSAPTSSERSLPPPYKASRMQLIFFWLAGVICSYLSWWGIDWPPVRAPAMPTFVFQHRSADDNRWNADEQAHHLGAGTENGDDTDRGVLLVSDGENEQELVPPPRYLTTKESRNVAATYDTRQPPTMPTGMVYTEGHMSWLLRYDEGFYNDLGQRASWAAAAEPFNIKFGTQQTGNSLKMKFKAYKRVIQWRTVVEQEGLRRAS